MSNQDLNPEQNRGEIGTSSIQSEVDGTMEVTPEAKANDPEIQPKIEGSFVVLDPRPQSLDAMIALVSATPTLGIELTVPEIAKHCVGNIDPQHSEGKNISAIEAVSSPDFEIPTPEVQLATVRADNDAIGAMAVIGLRRIGVELSDETMVRIARIATGDKARTGKWQPETRSFDDRDWDYVGLARIVADFKKPVAERVQLMADWLMTGTCEGSDTAIDIVKLELAEAIAKTDVWVEGSVAQVNGEHRGAMAIGYEQAPVVIAANPNFKIAGGEPHLKYTVGQWSAGYADLKSVLVELQALEPGWGGSDTIIGSPQGESSQLTMEQILEIVAKHTTFDEYRSEEDQIIL
ncbi:MAG: hypothetical protein WC553_00685 [Patescibacteria group bacterium]|jgi:hypothetical protein